MAERKHAVTAALVLAGLGAAALAPEQVTAVLWKYLWGPIVADAHNQATAAYHGITAHRGYNAVNEIVYGITAILSLLLLKNVFDRFEIKTGKRFIIALSPFIVFGALLRVIEDTGAVGYPFNVVLISPLIYFTVFFITLGAIMASHRLQGDGYEDQLFLTGTGLAVLPLLFLTLFALRNGISPHTPVLVGFCAAAILGGIGIQRYVRHIRPDTFLNTNIGVLALVGHLLDGAATSYSLAALSYTEKHPVSEWIMSVAGTPYAFLVVKGVFLFTVLALIEQEENEDRFTIFALFTIIVVGLGPGIRNLVRAVLQV